jgi:hypothetical protein
MGNTSATGGAGGGKSGGGGGGDPTGGLGGDPTGGLGLGGDPTGMGGMNPAMGFGDTFASLSDPGASGVQQQMATRGFSQGQQPLTDQPGAPAQQPQQGSQQQVPLPRERPPMTAEQMAQWIFHGPAGPSGTPGAAPFSARFGATEDPAGFAERFGASDPSNIYNNTGSPGLTPDQFNARFAGNPPPSPTTGAANVPLPPPRPGIPDTSADVPLPPPRPDIPGASANVPLPPSRPDTGQNLPATATPQVTPPGTQAPAGMAPQSPLEQVISDFVHMLFGGGQGGFSGLERMIASMLGVNPRWMFPGFYGGGFNRPPGPGYFPPGTVGGRQPGVGPAGPPEPQPPQAPTRPMPGEPPAPQGLQQQASLSSPATGDAASFIQSRGGHTAGTNAPNLNPDFASRLTAAGQAYEKETGQRANFGETGRSHDVQAKYYQEYKRTGRGLAARPGTSRHERGLATDIPHGPFQDWMHRNAARFGIEGLRTSRDPSHFQMSGGARPTAQASEARLPGPPYTATRADQPPPWYRPERNPASARPTASATPPASATGQRVEINPPVYEKMFAGTPLAGQSENIARVAKANGVPPAVMASIMAYETGRGRSRIMLQQNNPAGIALGPHNYRSYATVQDGIEAAGRAIGNNWRRAGGDIARMAHIYAPVGAGNDPGTNREWPRAVMRFQQMLGL